MKVWGLGVTGLAIVLVILAVNLWLATWGEVSALCTGPAYATEPCEGARLRQAIVATGLVSSGIVAAAIVTAAWVVSRGRAATDDDHQAK